jgi:hypothetical protein
MLHRVIVDVVERCVVMTLSSHTTIFTPEPALPATLTVHPIHLERSPPMEFALSFRELLNVLNLDQHMVVIRQDHPCGARYLLGLQVVEQFLFEPTKSIRGI